MKKIFLKHKKLLVRIGSILACLLLVGALVLPCFADLDTVIEQAELLNSLYANFDIDVTYLVQTLSSADRDFSSVVSSTVIDDRLFNVALGNFISASTGTLEVFGALSLQVIGDAVDPVYAFEQSYFFLELLTIEDGTNLGVLYNISIPQSDGSTVHELTLAYSLYPVSETEFQAKFSGIIHEDDNYTTDDFLISGHFTQFIGGVYSEYGAAPLFGLTVYPARDLQLNIPEGGASQEELDAAYQNGYTQGERLGTQIGYDIGYNEGEEAGYNEGYQLGLTNGANIGYDEGYLVGVNKGQTDSIGENFFGNTFSAIIDGLRSFTIIEFPNGYSYSLLDIVTAIVAISVFILFLKMFAGG